MESQIRAESQPPGSVTQDDRIWAAVAHGSSMLVFFGPIIAVIMWFTRRGKSAYVTFQTLQAMIYQSLFFWTWVVLIPLLSILMVVIGTFAAALAPNMLRGEFIMAVLPQLVIWSSIIGTFVVYGGIGMWGAVASLMGRDFYYPFFGKSLARRLEYHGTDTVSIPEDKEDYVVGAVCHSTSVITMWGLITPIIVWITQHDRSKILRFQALQAIIYQVIGLIAYFVFFALYFVFIFGMIGLSFAFRPGSSAPPAWMGVAALPFLAVVCIFAIGGPAYQLLAFVAALRVLDGHDFRYPILGNMLAARLNHTEGK